MKLSDKPTAYLMLQGRTDSEYTECGYAIIPITENWRQEMQMRLDALVPYSKKYNLYSMVYDATSYFYGDDNDIDSLELLGDRHWSFVIPTKKDVKFLSTPENRILGFILEITKDGWAKYSTHGHHDEEFWTVEFSIAEVLERFEQEKAS